jgi:hypothetical protein
MIVGVGVVGVKLSFIINIFFWLIGEGKRATSCDKPI